MAKVRLENVSKSFSNKREGAVNAVHQLSFAMEPAELLVLVGPSGCGKTTTLRLIAGLETIDSGQILFDQEVIHTVPPDQRDVAMVFQTPALFPHLTAFENLALGLKLRKTPRAEIEERVAEAAQTVGMESKLHRYPQELSGGEAQRVALARALVRRPRLFLLDEPLSNLDPIIRKQLRREIVCLQKTSRTPMVYVTHDHREAFAIGHRVAVLNHGSLQQIGTPDEIRRSPANEFVAEFITDDFQ